MKKGTTFCFLLIIGLIMLSSFSVSAKSLTTTNIKVSNYVQIADKEDDKFEKQCKQNPACAKEDHSVLGNVDCECTVAWLLNEILGYLKIIGPFLILILSSIEFVSAIMTSDDESLAKAQKNLITRLILASALFVLPTLISVILNVFGITSGEISIFM